MTDETREHVRRDLPEVDRIESDDIREGTLDAWEATLDDEGETEVGDMLGHPYYGIYVAERAGLPMELQHIVLSHTRTLVEPATLETAIVRAADMADAAAIKSRAVDDLRDA